MKCGLFYSLILLIAMSSMALSGCLQDAKLSITSKASSASPSSSGGSSARYTQRVSQTSGALPTSNDNTYSQMLSAGSDIYFAADNGTGYRMLYKLSGGVISQITTAATKYSDASPLTVLGVTTLAGAGTNKLYYIATDTSFISRLFVLDMGLGTNLALDNISCTTYHYSPTYSGVVNDVYYFEGYCSGDTSSKSYKASAGTGVVLLVDANPTADDFTQAFVGNGANVFFKAKTGTSSFQQFRYDGSTTTMHQTTTLSTDNAEPSKAVPIGTDTFFSACSGAGCGTKNIYKVTNAGVMTTLVNDDNAFDLLGEIGGKLIYNNLTEIQKVDVSTGLHSVVHDTYGAGSDNPMNAVISGGYVYFNAYDGSVYRNYKADAVSGAQLPAVNAGSDFGSGYRMVGSDVYFTNNNAFGFYKLYRSNGVVTVQVSDTNAIASDSAVILADDGSNVVFTALDPGSFTKLYLYNSSSQSVLGIGDLSTGMSDMPINSQVMVQNGYFYFSIYVNATYYAIFRY